MPPSAATISTANSSDSQSHCTRRSSAMVVVETVSIFHDIWATCYHPRRTTGRRRAKPSRHRDLTHRFFSKRASPNSADTLAPCIPECRREVGVARFGSTHDASSGYRPVGFSALGFGGPGFEACRPAVERDSHGERWFRRTRRRGQHRPTERARLSRPRQRRRRADSPPYTAYTDSPRCTRVFETGPPRRRC